MTVPRNAILIGAALSALIVAALVAFALMRPPPDGDGSGSFYSSLVGGPFQLKTHDGAPISNEDLKGKPFAIFFGFTQCPDVCPTSMLELTDMIQKLGPDADRMRFLFVSVDPERDTPDLLKAYLSNFDSRITGLVGTTDEIAAIAKAYRVYYEKVPTSGSYTINHTATIYLMDAQGRLANTLAYGEDADSRLKKLRRVLGKS